jgi:hypothetical protein
MRRHTPALKELLASHPWSGPATAGLKAKPMSPKRVDIVVPDSPPECAERQDDTRGGMRVAGHEITQVLQMPLIVAEGGEARVAAHRGMYQRRHNGLCVVSYPA